MWFVGKPAKLLTSRPVVRFHLPELMISNTTIYRIAELVDADPDGQSIDELFKSLAEEFGEVARIVNGKPHDEPLYGELADVIITSLAMFHRRYGYVDSYINIDDVINRKLDKWKAKQERLA